MKTTSFKYLVLALISVAVYVSCAPNGGGEASNLLNKPAKDFSLQTIDGGSVKVSDYKGNVLVIDFWATWCPPCRQSLPNLDRLSNDPALAKRGLKVLAVNSQEAPATIKDFLNTNHYTFPVALDTDGAAERLYDVSGLPTTLLVGRDGAVKKLWVGFDPASTEAELSTAIESALSK